MLCHICKKNEATVHITEITSFPVVDVHADDAEAENVPAPEFEESHVCERCAHRSKVPFTAPTTNKGLAVWNMLKESARRAREESAITCPDCGMTMAEFRSKGRLGCPKDYEVFAPHIRPLLLRIHNATTHKGRIPGVDESEREKDDHLTGLRKKLEEAIRAEAYESAAQLRDQIQSLEALPEEPA